MPGRRLPGGGAIRFFAVARFLLLTLLGLSIPLKYTFKRQCSTEHSLWLTRKLCQFSLRTVLVSMGVLPPLLACLVRFHGFVRFVTVMGIVVLVHLALLSALSLILIAIEDSVGTGTRRRWCKLFDEQMP